MFSGENSSETAGRPGVLGRTVLYLDGSKRFKKNVSFSVFIIGLLLWICVQGGLALIPLWTRALPPETDDSLTYVLKSRQMEDCFNQNCPALKDLRSQLLYGNWKHPSSHKQRVLAASRIFPVYHPLLSVVIVALKNLGMGWMTAYKVIWTAGPVLFCIAFAWLLVKLWGLSAAGVALCLLAFKVFPDTGLHCVVPSNITMAMAVIIWAQIISKKGNALIALIVGSIIMVSTHPMGIIYSVMSVFITLAVSEDRYNPKTWVPLMIVFCVAGIAFFIADIIKGPLFIKYYFLPRGIDPLKQLIIGAGQNMGEFIAGILRLESGLFGNPGILFGAVSFGILTLPYARRSPINRTILIYVLFILGLMFYVSSHPADVIFRMWIPLVVILFGAVGHAIWYSFKKSWELLVKNITHPDHSGVFNFSRIWPAVVLAILLGYAVQMSVRGGEQVISVGLHMKAREPLRFETSQVDKLLSEARPGDRVFYTSVIIMPYYLINGAMDLGAVYYHPSLKNSPIGKKWINRPDVRFAVTYNPTVYHPSFEGVEENRWWVQSPEFYFSPLNKRRKYSPISIEGHVPVNRFKWMQIKIKDKGFQDSLSLKILNPGKNSYISIIPVRKRLKRGKKNVIRKRVPANWNGWIKFDLTSIQPSRQYRIQFPRRDKAYSIGGAVFGNDPLNWPWAQKADLYFMYKDADTGLVKISFDPRKILPPPLNSKRISVLDDEGSSVLFRIQQ
jgi:hypothetical protein